MSLWGLDQVFFKEITSERQGAGEEKHDIEEEEEEVGVEKQEE